MGRRKLNPDDKKILFNCKLADDTFERLKLICYRRSVHNGKRFSEGALVTEMVLAAPIPAEPTARQITAYQGAFADRKVQRVSRTLVAETRMLRSENIRLKEKLAKPD